jgi:predicted nucleotidyltransferase
MSILNENKKISELCRKYNVNQLYLFGSYSTGNFTPQSDIDFLVRFDEVDLYNYFDNYLELKQNLEQLLNVPVDLVEEQTVKNPFLLHSINQSKQLIYGH